VAIQTLARTKLETLVENFDRDSASRNQIRDLLESDPRSFREGVVRVFKSPSASLRGAQFVISLLVERELLISVMGDPALKLEEAVSLARIALQVDPLTDVTLAKRLADNAALGESVENASRLMEVLGEISTGHRITSSLMRLWRNSDPQMRSKAVLLIGRSSGSVQWAQSRLTETDPRMRANAIEALWGVESAAAKELLHNASHDGNNRVAGNALFALYRMGDVSAIPKLFKMAASDSPLFRSSAAWAMGETGDPRFAETLGHMMGETNAIVRKRAFSALVNLKAAVKARQSRVWRVAGRLLPHAGNMRELRLEASATDGSAAPTLLPTQFVLTEDGHAVPNYQVEMAPPVELLSLTFMLPHSEESAVPPWLQGAIGCIPWKRPSDSWCTTFYVPANEKGAETPNSPQFSADNQVAATALQEWAPKTGCPTFWDGLRNAVQAVGAPERGPRRLILFHDASAAGAAPEMAEFISAATGSNTSVQAISMTPSPQLEELCSGTNGHFQLAQSEPEIQKFVEEAYLALLPRFLVTYQPVSHSARALTVRVFDATGSGETTISM
jgi:hypothetical protein